MNAYLLSQTMEYLGFVIHSKSHSLYLRLENVAEIITLCSTALKRDSVSLMEIAKGLIKFCCHFGRQIKAGFVLVDCQCERV